MGRNPQFTNAEIKKLLEIIARYKNILDCKKSEVPSTKAQREDAWHKIALDFNAKTDVYRDVKELKAKYKNVRYSMKSKQPAEFTPAEELCRDLLQKKEIEDEGTVLAFQIAKLEDESLHLSPEDSIEQTITPEDAEFTALPTDPLLSHNCSNVQNSNNKTSSLKLAEIKTKYAEEKMRIELHNAKKAAIQSDERHKKEMQILDIKLQREQVQLQKEKLQLKQLILTLPEDLISDN